MAPKSPPMTEEYRMSVRGLRRLHVLFVQGLDDGEEGDAIRDELELPWHRMTKAEQDRIRVLSADLYTIADPPHAVRVMTPEAEEKLSEVLAARDSRDWDLALHLLRTWGEYLHPAELAALRGQIWLEAGDAETARLFTEHAVALDPAMKDVDATSFLPHTVPGRS